jgi:hypothetical protein
MMTTIDTATTAQMRPITSSVSILPPNQFPSGNGPFSAEPRSPRGYFLDVLKVRLVVTPCAALLNEKIAHFQIGNEFELVSVLTAGSLHSWP